MILTTYFKDIEIDEEIVIRQVIIKCHLIYEM